jgi:hypothetical protein
MIVLADRLAKESNANCELSGMANRKIDDTLPQYLKIAGLHSSQLDVYNSGTRFEGWTVFAVRGLRYFVALNKRTVNIKVAQQPMIAKYSVHIYVQSLMAGPIRHGESDGDGQKASQTKAVFISYIMIRN